MNKAAAGALAVIVLLVAVRAPLHLATHALPVSNDDAIPLLMARHALQGEQATILWNQPYNGTLDAYLLAPFVAVMGAHAGFRLYQALCALALVLLASLLAARAAQGCAGLMAGLIAAAGTPYMALMAATGPPPNFLVPLLVAAVALVGFARLTSGPRVASIFLAGLIAGLGVWDSALVLPAVVGLAVGFLLAGLRPSAGGVAAFAAGLMIGGAPLLVARIVGASAATPVTAIRPRWLWMDGLHDLVRATVGLSGLEVPLVVDGPERAALPLVATAALGLALAGLVVAGAMRRRSLPLVGWSLGLAAAFALSRRTGGDEVRYLFGLTLPVLALAGIGLARAWQWRPALALIAFAAVVGPWLAGDRILLHAWRDPSHAVRVWQVPPLEPALTTLRRAGVRSAYASLQLAGRLTLESEEQVIASQAWNERIPGDPLRFRDEVDLDPRAAWVLSPHLSRGMPRAEGFRALLRDLGGSWHEDLPGDFVVFRAFRPPYDERRAVSASSLRVSTVEGTPLPPAIFDRDLDTAWRAPVALSRGYGLAFAFEPLRRIAAIVLAVDLERSPLAVPWVVEAGGEILARGPARHGLQWVNGAPRAGKQALLAIPLGDRPLASARLLFQDAGPPLAVSEVFAYGPDEPEREASGAEPFAAALGAARVGQWDEAVRLYAEAASREPERASYHACLARARWRAAHRRRLDVESLDDGGEALVRGPAR